MQFGNVKQTKFDQYKISAILTGFITKDPWDNKLERLIRPKYEIIITNLDNNKKAVFDYWGSAIFAGPLNYIVSPDEYPEQFYAQINRELLPKLKKLTELDLLESFEMILSDGLSGTQYTANQFQAEFGYDNPVQALSIYLKCQQTSEQLNQVGIYDVEKLAERLRETIENMENEENEKAKNE